MRTKLLIIAITLFCSACARNIKSQIFSTPEAAVVALQDAVANKSADKAKLIFGEEGDFLLHRGDPVQDKARAQKFAELFNQKHALIDGHDGNKILTVGNNNWPFPVPLAKARKGWYFDVEAGRDTVLSRQIGSNEFKALSVLKEIYTAQRVYAAKDRDNDGKLEYADRIISTPDTNDGLYWPSNADPSPFGPNIAQAANEDYVVTQDGLPHPYKGYYFKIFKVDADANVIDDALSKPGSYVAIAQPVEWGVSGIMTFAINERGWIYQKSLREKSDFSEGPPTLDRSWKRIG